jgi:hypothetical protein
MYAVKSHTSCQEESLTGADETSYRMQLMQYTLNHQLNSTCDYVSMHLQQRATQQNMHS